MGRWNLAELAAAVGVSPAPDQEQSWRGLELDDITTDSRHVQPNSLFVALRGDRFDGHDFVDVAVSRGASAVMVDKAGYAELTVPVVRVQDTLQGLGDAAKLARRKIKGLQVVGVTGSNGKTTTKELLAAALGARGPVHKTKGNQNNQIGVPFTLFACPDLAWAAVVEMGMSAPGEIAYLASIAEPDVAIITNVGPAHLEGLGTVEAVARAKCELIAARSVETAVINADDDLLVATANKVLGQKRLLTFGTRAGCDVQLVDARPSDDGTSQRVALSFATGDQIDLVLPLAGRHNALNAAGAATAAFALGMKPADIARGLQSVQAPVHRLRVHRNVGCGLNLVDDSYNSNPASTRVALSTIRDLAAGAEQPHRRVIAILGDMFELGDASPEMHRDVGLAAAENGVDVVYAAGPLAKHTAEGALEGAITAHAFSDVESLQDALRGALNVGDWILVKGSRGMRMERVVDWIAMDGAHA